jgi:hypothetical protein
VSLALVSTVLVSLSGFVQAGAVVSCDGKSGIDFGDAPAAYGVACHHTDEWQRLGNSWSSEAATKPVDSDNFDDGVTWRTKASGSSTWSAWSSNAVLTQGDDVEFSFEFNRADYGNHEYDELKTWIDWDRDTNWSNANEVLINEQWHKNQNANDVDEFNSSFNNDLGTNNNSDTSRVYTTQITIPLNAVLGDTWMRARIVCENSLSNYSVNRILEATGFQDQGEVEDYKLTVVAKNRIPVPEPSTLLVFTLGLLGLGLKRRKMS